MACFVLRIHAGIRFCTMGSESELHVRECRLILDSKISCSLPSHFLLLSLPPTCLWALLKFRRASQQARIISEGTYLPHEAPSNAFRSRRRGRHRLASPRSGLEAHQGRSVRESSPPSVLRSWQHLLLHEAGEWMGLPPYRQGR